MKVVPQLLYQHKNVRKIMVDGLSSIVYKNIDTIDTDTDHYVATHVISIVLKGKLSLKTYYEGEKFIASQNQVVFIPKGRYMISDIIPENGQFEAVFFFIEEEMINEFLYNKINIFDHSIKNNYNYVMEYTNELRVFTKNILELYNGDHRQFKNVTKLKLLELLYLFYNSKQKDNFIELLFALQKVEKRNIKDLMKHNFDKPLSIADYAFLSGRSLSSFRRDFIRQFRLSSI